MERKTDFQTQSRVVEQVCDKKIPAVAYFAAVDFKITDKNLIGKLSDVIIEGGRPEWNYFFARDVENAKKEEHIEEIIKSKSAIWNCRCVQTFENVDMKINLLFSKNLTSPLPSVKQKRAWKCFLNKFA